MTAEDRVRAAFAEMAEAVIALAREQAQHTTSDAPVELISVDEFARRAGIGRSSAWLAVSSGSIPSVKVGARRVISSGELARLARGEAFVPVTPSTRARRRPARPA